MPAFRFALMSLVCGLCPAATPPAPYISSASIVNAATGQPGLAPYSICTIYGSNLFLNGAATSSGQSEVPNVLGGVTVLINSNYAGIFYASATQINALIPNSLLPGTYSLTVLRDGQGSETVPLLVQEVAPGLFPAAFHVDGTAVTADTPAASGEIVVFYGTGFGRMQPDPVGRAIMPSSATIVHAADFGLLIDGVVIDPALVQYVGAAPGNAGLYQINVQMPGDLQAGSHEVLASVAGVLSPVGLRLFTAD